MSKLMNQVRADFVKVLEDPEGDSFQALIDGSHALRALQPSMSIHECAAQLTDWAIQDGYFEASERSAAEQGAEEVIEAAE